MPDGRAGSGVPESEAHVLTAPDPGAACAFAREHLGARMLQLVGNCTIDYQGRAQSTLGAGERLVLVKPDGTLIVHTDKGLKPVNWQPGGTSMAVAVRTVEKVELLVLTVERASPKELVTIAFDHVLLAAAYRMRDWEDLQLLGSEADIAQLLAMNPHLIEEGFEPTDIELDRRRGPMDLYGTDANGTRVVVEVKRRTAGIKEATQLFRYVEREREVHTSVRGILVAPGCSPKAMKYLADKALDYRALDLEALLPRIPRVHATQRTLGNY